jgi:hypothetical protein
MTQKGIDLGLSHILRIGLGSMELDEPENPIAPGLLGAIGLIVISEHIPDLIHQAQIVIRPEFLLAFRLFHAYSRNMENGAILFP